MVAAIVSPSSLTNPARDISPAAPEQALQIPERARFAIQIGRIQNFVNQMLVHA